VSARKTMNSFERPICVSGTSRAYLSIAGRIPGTW